MSHMIQSSSCSIDMPAVFIAVISPYVKIMNEVFCESRLKIHMREIYENKIKAQHIWSLCLITIVVDSH